MTDRKPVYSDAENMIEQLREENRILREQLEEAKAANEAKEVFLSNMSHDIRTPMNAIVGMTALARKYIDEKSRVEDALNKIETASGHLLNLINDVLDMSQINSGRLKLAENEFSLSDLLHDIITIIQPQMEKKHHNWTFELGEIGAERFIGDSLRLRQIFVNIISNAVKYTDDGGNIRIGITEQMPEKGAGPDDICHLVFRCTDNGIGMSEEFLARVFEPFERVHNSTVSKIEGTGLGMSIVRKIVDAMQGGIEITSRQGSGTDVVITIPLRYEEEKVNTSALEKSRILVLESDSRMQETYRRYFEEYKIRYTIVSSAASALSELTQAGVGNDPFHAVLIGKDENDGSIFEIASYLKDSFPELVRILVSADHWPEIEYRALRSGIQHFIPTPFFRKSLLNGINDALLEQDSQTGGHGQAATPDLQGRHILLAEDNLINTEIAREILESTGASVDTAENGRIAADLYLASGESWYDLILMDIQMPVMDGYEACRLIRHAGRSDSDTIAIYAMTANTFAEDISKARQAGMNGHIAKPIDIQTLMHVLRHI